MTKTPYPTPRRHYFGRRLLIALQESGYTVHDAAPLLGMSPASLHRKVRGQSAIYLDELELAVQLTGKDWEFFA